MAPATGSIPRYGLGLSAWGHSYIYDWMIIMIRRLITWLTSLFKRQTEISIQPKAWKSVFAGDVSGPFSFPVAGPEPHGDGLGWSYSCAQLYAENRGAGLVTIRVSGLTVTLAQGGKTDPPIAGHIIIEQGQVNGWASGPAYVHVHLF